MDGNNQLKRRASPNDPDTDQQAKRSRKPNSSEIALDTLFAGLLDKPHHYLYQHNVDVLVDGAFTRISAGTSAQQAVSQPLLELLTFVRACCTDDSPAERALVAQIEDEYGARVLQGLAATLCEDSSKPPRDRVITGGFVSGHTVTLHVTPVIGLSDSDAEGDGERADDVGPSNARDMANPQVNEAVQDVESGRVNERTQVGDDGKVAKPQANIMAQDAGIRRLSGGFQMVDEREIARPQVKKAAQDAGIGHVNEGFHILGERKIARPQLNRAAQGIVFGRANGLSQGSIAGQHITTERPQPGIPASRLPQAPPGTVIVRDDVVGLDHSGYLALNGTSLSYTVEPAAQRSLALRPRGADMCILGALLESDVRAALIQRLPGPPPIQSVEKKALTVAGDNGLRKELDPTYLITFANEEAAWSVRSAQIKVLQQDFRLDPLQFGPHRTWLCSNVPTRAEGAKRPKVLHSLLAMFPAPYLMCVKTATKVGGHVPSTDGFILVTLSQPVGSRYFSFDFTPMRKSGPNIKAAFLPLIEAFKAPCLVCDSLGHVTELCPEFVTLRLANALLLHPRILPSLPVLKPAKAPSISDGFGVQASVPPGYHPQLMANMTAHQLQNGLARGIDNSVGEKPLPDRTRESSTMLSPTAQPMRILGQTPGQSSTYSDPAIKQEHDIEAGSGTTVKPPFMLVADISGDVDNCICLVGQFLVDSPNVGSPEFKLMLQDSNGAPAFGYLLSQQEIDTLRGEVSRAIVRAFGSKHSFQVVKQCQKHIKVAFFSADHLVNAIAGRNILLNGQQITFARIPAPASTFFCHDVPIGADGVSHRSVLHSLLHLFNYEPFCVRVASAQDSTADRLTGTYQVTFTRPKGLASFGATLGLQGGQHHLTFKPDDTARASCCICDSRVHTTQFCPVSNWVVLVLNTPVGPHPRMLQALPT